MSLYELHFHGWQCTSKETCLPSHATGSLSLHKVLHAAGMAVAAAEHMCWPHA
jgi:hypothetical protein